MSRMDRYKTVVALRGRQTSGPPNDSPTLPAEPQPLADETVSGAGAAGFLKSLVHDTELLMLGLFLAALCAWFVYSLQPAARDRRPVAEAQSILVRPAPPQQTPFALVPDRARDWIMPALIAFEPKPESRPASANDAQLPPPDATAPVAEHALVAEPVVDPLGTLVVSGLPKSSRLSAGADVSAADAPTSDWAIALADLDNLVITLPPQRDTPLRTTIDLRTRAGVKITSLTLEVREDPPVAAAAVEEPQKPKEAAKISRAPAKKSNVKAARAARQEVKKPVLPDAAEIEPAAKTATVDPPPAPTGLSAILPKGLFKPDPKDSATSGLSPDLRDDPRFTTLRGLGMSGAGTDNPEAE